MTILYNHNSVKTNFVSAVLSNIYEILKSLQFCCDEGVELLALK